VNDFSKIKKKVTMAKARRKIKKAKKERKAKVKRRRNNHFNKLMNQTKARTTTTIVFLFYQLVISFENKQSLFFDNELLNSIEQKIK